MPPAPEGRHIRVSVSLKHVAPPGLNELVARALSERWRAVRRRWLFANRSVRLVRLPSDNNLRWIRANDRTASGLVTLVSPVMESNVSRPEFKPGCRLSALDICVLFCGTVGSVVAWQWVWWVGFVIAFVVAHFFLFCNVFRISRPLELVWAAAFVTLAGNTLVNEAPSWMNTIVGSLIVTVVVIAIEMCRPSYHGIAWQRLNPRLPQWWESRFAEHASPSH